MRRTIRQSRSETSNYRNCRIGTGVWTGSEISSANSSYWNSNSVILRGFVVDNDEVVKVALGDIRDELALGRGQAESDRADHEQGSGSVRCGVEATACRDGDCVQPFQCYYADLEGHGDGSELDADAHRGANVRLSFHPPGDCRATHFDAFLVVASIVLGGAAPRRCSRSLLHSLQQMPCFYCLYSRGSSLLEKGDVKEWNAVVLL